MSTSHQIDTVLLEHIIARVRGVVAARIVASAEGQIDEIHIVGTPDRNPKQMVRDVESLLYVQGGVRIDHRKISLVQIADPAMLPAKRLRFVALEPLADDAHAGVSVTLSLNGRDVRGVGQNRPDQHLGADTLAGYATVNALNQLLNEQQSRLQLDHIEQQTLGETELILAKLSLVTHVASETLLGISTIQESSAISVSRAVLDAVNRRLQKFLLNEKVGVLK